jgi:hypothetical protein
VQTSPKPRPDSALKLLRRYELDLSLVYVTSTALRFSQPEFLRVFLAQIVQTFQQAIGKPSPFLNREIQGLLFDRALLHGAIVAPGIVQRLSQSLSAGR